MTCKLSESLEIKAEESLKRAAYLKVSENFKMALATQWLLFAVAFKLFSSAIEF